jgi:histidyl-tRNA synthetase
MTTEKAQKKNKYLSSQPYKGARDFYPEEMRLQNYIFNTWRRVCKSYGFEEYMFPIIEPFETFAAKTGEEIVREQLYSFEDRGGRRLAIRPELTPGTVRMIAQKYKVLPKPIKWFMIGNNWRAEKPQKGRGREFYQLETNIFAVEDVVADAEIFSIIVDIMKAFGANEEMFSIRVSDRRLIKCLLEETLGLEEEVSVVVRRLMDKRAKMSLEKFMQALQDAGLVMEQAQKVEVFMTATLETLEEAIEKETLHLNKGCQVVQKLFQLLENRGLAKYVKFDPAIIRGFDYSDGLVYEVFDKSTENKRSMFGGERFDKLVNIFGNYKLEATGFAMGDWTLIEFLKAWDLLPDTSTETAYLITCLPEMGQKKEYDQILQSVAGAIRKTGKNVETWIEKDTKLDKQLKYADQRGIPKVIIIGEDELRDGTITIKNMQTGKQEIRSLDSFENELK